MSKVFPSSGDYVQLLDENNKLSENFTLIKSWDFDLIFDLFVITDIQGETFAVARDYDLDTDLRKGWQQIITATA